MILESKGTPKSPFTLNINESTDKYNLVADVKINFTFGDRYNANMNYKECLNSNFKNCIININYPISYEIPDLLVITMGEICGCRNSGSNHL